MIKYLCACCIALFSVSSFSQTSALAGSDVKIDVLAVYEEVVDQGYESIQVYRKLANGRFFQKNFEAAKKWYSRLFKMDSDPDPIEYLRFSETLAALEEYDLARNFKHRYEQTRRRK